MPTWSKWAWVRTSASTSSGERPRSASADWSDPHEVGTPASTIVRRPASSRRYQFVLASSIRCTPGATSRWNMPLRMASGAGGETAGSGVLPRPHELAETVHRQLRGLRGGDEIAQQRREPLRVVVEREVPGAGDDLEAAVRHEVGGLPPVLHGDDAVPFAPHHERGDVGRQVEPVARVDPLPPRVDHGAGRMQEGAAPPTVPERVEPLEQPLDIGALLDAEA